MKVILPAAIGAFCVFVALLGIAGTAKAQSMTPMRGSVTSFTDAFAVRVFPTNPYAQRIPLEIHVYDQDFYEIDARISLSRFTLPAGGSRRITVVVPFAGQTERRIRICTESIPFPNQQTTIRTQICGKFIGRRR